MQSLPTFRASYLNAATCVIELYVGIWLDVKAAAIDAFVACTCDSLADGKLEVAFKVNPEPDVTT